MLEYTNTPLPSYPALCRVENIYFEEEEALPRDPYPHGWKEREWKVYNAMIDARRKTYRELAKESYVREYYLRILEQFKTLVCFFPLLISFSISIFAS